MRLLRPNTFVSEVLPGKLQVGSAPPHTVVFSDLSVGEREWVYSLMCEDDQSHKRVEQAEKDMGAASLAQESSRGGLTERQTEMLLILDAAGLLEPDIPPLWDLSFRIVGLDEVGGRVATLLAAEGAKELDLQDRRAVDMEIAGLFNTGDLGQSKQVALGRNIRSRFLDVRVGAVSVPDLVVVSSHNTWDHAILGRLLSDDTPHLPIVQRDREVQVGPLVMPGHTACAICADMTVGDSFPLWPQTALALGRAPKVHTPEYLASTAAGLAVSLIHCAATGSVPQGATLPAGTGGAAHSFTVRPTGVETREWTPHKRCGCGKMQMMVQVGMAA